MKAGAVAFLTKPVQREALFEALQRALARDPAERTAPAEAEQLRVAFAALTADRASTG
jgi:FixJ family two-component response regulator